MKLIPCAFLCLLFFCSFQKLRHEEYTRIPPPVPGLACQMRGEFMPGVASMNLNVHPRLAPYAESGWTTDSNKKYEPFLNALRRSSRKWKNEEKGLKDYYKAFFPMGVAVNAHALKGEEAELLLREFNSITPENAMKMAPIHPRKGEYNWAPADSIVSFAQQHHLRIRGHTLLWHRQAPDWIFEDDEGDPVGKEELLRRLKAHIFEVVGRYKGKIYAWDVVNEAIDDHPERVLRQSKWVTIGGEEILAKAFEYAHQADPDALLFYNDYNTVAPEKREKIYRLLKKLLDAGVPVHGVGVQAHWSIFGPSASALEQTIKRYAALGLQIHITELDLSVYRGDNDNRRSLSGEKNVFTASVEQQQADQYEKIFSIFRKYKEHITSVTFWNLSDRYSWLNHYPVPGRKNYPLLFDRALKRKKAYWKVIDFEVPLAGYELVWSDEFNVPGKPDNRNWSYERGFVRNHELQYYQAANAVVKDGLLVIEGRREKVKNAAYQSGSDDWRRSREYAAYSSASINTRGKREFQYGIIEVRARIDPAKGMWPAIWTLGASKAWPANGEVDVMEYYRVNGEPMILANAAWLHPEGGAMWDEAKISYADFLAEDREWAQKFHTWKMEWTKDQILLYLDGKISNEIDLSLTKNPDGYNPFRQPHYILLNLAIGSNGGDPSDTGFPRKYEVDYVRVYQKR